MAFVHINAKEATTVAMRTLSGLKGKEKRDFEKYFKEFIYWQVTNEDIQEITKLGKKD